MSKPVIFAILIAASVATAGSKDRNPKVPYHEMALNMRDAFNCGVLVEEHLHGRLKDNQELYNKQRDTNNCEHVETILNTLDDQDGADKQ